MQAAEGRAGSSQVHMQIQAIDEAIQKLPEKQRMAVILRRYEELPYDEIGRILDLSLPAVKSLLFRARTDLLSLAIIFARRGREDLAAIPPSAVSAETTAARRANPLKSLAIPPPGVLGKLSPKRPCGRITHMYNAP